MPQIFRAYPPRELVEEVTRAFGLTGLQDATWFAKSHLNLQQLEALFPELEPYYIPCKAKEFLHPSLTQARGVTILKQLCKIHDIQITAAERTCAGVKGMWYQITPTGSTGATSILIDFT
jgi:hypothetical protein